MRKAILIQCHANADQINLLLKHLVSQKHTIDIYIHVDSKSDIKDKINCSDNVFFTEKRIDVRWGNVSQIYATLELMKMTENKAYDYVSLISGLDFPIKHIDLLCEFLEKHKDSSFIEYFPLPNKGWRHNGGVDRVKTSWSPYLLGRRDFFSRFALKIWRNTVGKVITKDIRPLGKLHGGSQWFTLTGEAVDYLLKFLKDNPNYLKIYKNSFCADELFFQTFFLNSPFKDLIVNNNLRFIKWEKGSRSPKILTMDEWDDIIGSNCFFMRKVDLKLSRKLIDKITTSKNFTE